MLQRLLIGLCFLIVARPTYADIAAPQIDVVISDKVAGDKFSGRLFVMFAQKPLKDGPPSMSWFSPDPFHAQDVGDLKSGVPHRFVPSVSLQPLTSLTPGKYSVHAVLDRDLGGQSPLSSPGNLYGPSVEIELGKDKAASVVLRLEKVAPTKPFSEKEHIKLVDIPSPLLTRFHGKPMRLRAGVLLPTSYSKETDRRYAVIYEIPGFGGDHHHVARAEARKATEVAGVEMIHVTLDPACRLGHHVFADSDNNGPYGQALTEELIPHIEKTFRTIAAPPARFVTGHSSGGWSSLWLQVTYPDFFGGVWSTAPDPVDFRDFQKVDIYEKGVNLLFDEKGGQRALGRKAGKAVLFYKPFSDMEVVLGRGGQLFSFEAVFSPKGKDGKPRPLYDRKSGLVDAATAEAWKRYDINLLVQRAWAKLGPKVAGKIHIYMGAEDTYYLDGATRLLQKTLKDLGSDAVVEIFPGRDHGNLVTPELRERMNREMAAQLKRK